MANPFEDLRRLPPTDASKDLGILLKQHEQYKAYNNRVRLILAQLRDVVGGEVYGLVELSDMFSMSNLDKIKLLASEKPEWCLENHLFGQDLVGKTRRRITVQLKVFTEGRTKRIFRVSYDTNESFGKTNWNFRSVYETIDDSDDELVRVLKRLYEDNRDDIFLFFNKAA